MNREEDNKNKLENGEETVLLSEELLKDDLELKGNLDDLPL